MGDMRSTNSEYFRPRSEGLVSRNENILSLYSDSKITSTVKLTIFQSRHVLALVDTGAQRSVISSVFLNELLASNDSKLVRNIKSRLRPLNIDDPEHLIAANNAICKVLGKVRIDIKIDRFQFEHDFLILSGVSNNFFVGIDALKSGEGVYDTIRDVVTWGKEGKFVTPMLTVTERDAELALLTTEVRLAPNSQVTVDIKFSKPLQSKIALLNSIDIPCEGHVSIISGVVNTGGRKCCVLVNHGSGTVYLPANEPVGTAEMLDVRSIQSFKNEQVKKDFLSDVLRNLSATSGAHEARTNTKTDNLHCNINDVHAHGENVNNFDTLNALIPETDVDRELRLKVEYEIKFGGLKPAPGATVYKCADLGITIDNDDLTDQEKAQILAVVDTYGDVLSTKASEVTGSDLMKVQLELKDGAVPARVRSYPQTDEANEFIEGAVADLNEADIVESTVSPWSAPCLVVTKRLPNGKIKKRLVIDYRATNKALKDVFYDLPSWEELYAMVNKYRPKLMISLDLRSAYHSVKIHPASWPISAFTSSLNRKYCFKRASFGMKTSSAYFCQLINQILTLGDQNHKLLGSSVYAFVDDLIVMGRDVDDLCRNLAEVMRRLRAANVKLTGDKMVLATKSVAFLGSNVTIDGLSMTEDKVSALLDTPVPTNLKELKSALGFFSYYRRYIVGFSLVTDRMYGLMKKNTPFIWTKAIDDDWEKLKNIVRNSPILSYFNDDDTLYLFTDASARGVGWFLTAEPPDKNAPPKLIRAGGYRIEESMRFWGITSLEMAAVVSAVTALRTLIKGRKVIVVTDHSAIGHIMASTKQPPTGRLQRYATILQDYDLEFRFLPGKYNNVADHLSRRPYDNDIPARSQEEKDILHEEVASLTEVTSLKHPLENVIRKIKSLETRTKYFPEGGCRNTNPTAKADFANLPAVLNLSQANKGHLTSKVQFDDLMTNTYRGWYKVAKVVVKRHLKVHVRYHK